ncbi:MAG: hypothetical protein HPY81_02370 [Firmicutes bacterium]|nr:hypothetical protein [Bacillota bacterium]
MTTLARLPGIPFDPAVIVRTTAEPDRTPDSLLAGYYQALKHEVLILT